MLDSVDLLELLQKYELKLLQLQVYDCSVANTVDIRRPGENGLETSIHFYSKTCI